ncbi:MAG: hypothetical protein IJY59_06245 [Bacteroidaceae bacterium]|nr:hypothetical protein [Bacteroidaceae bacterium]
MKTNYKIFLAACSLIAVLSSCSQEAVIESGTVSQKKEYRTVSLQAGLGNDSRIAFQEGETAIDLLWEEQDAFSVLVGTNVQTPGVFTLTDGAGTPDGSFTGELACNDGDKLYAVWPLMTDSMEADNEYYWSLANQKGVLDDQYTFMFGQGRYSAEGSTRMSFHYRTAALRMNLQLPAGVEKITQVDIQVPGVYEGAKVCIDNGGLIFDGSTEGGVTINHEFEVIDGAVQVVAYFFAWDYSNLNNASVIVTDIDGNLYVGMLGSGNIRPGKLYDASVTLMGIVDFENESLANGTAEKPYEIDVAEQLYSFMWRCKKRMGDKEGNDYRHLHYKLSSDIVLDSRLTWDFFNFYGTFDGDGHTISGSIEKPLFSYMEGATISNLVLDLNYNVEGSFDFFGCLATSIHNCSILNVVNRSSISVFAEFMGGLVGCLDNQSKMIGCVNEGNLTALWDEVMYMGGLVGDLRGGSIVETCYNIGDLTASVVNGGNNSYFGGLVGYICEIWDYDNNLVGYDGTLTSCWSTGTLTIGSGYNPSVGDITGTGTYTSCFKVDTTPTAEQITEMNAAMTNALYEFDAAGNIVAKKPSISLPDIEIEDF